MDKSEEIHGNYRDTCRLMSRSQDANSTRNGSQKGRIKPSVVTRNGVPFSTLSRDQEEGREVMLSRY